MRGRHGYSPPVSRPKKVDDRSPRSPDRATLPAWLLEAAPAGLRSATPARWGFRHETWIVAAGDERLVLQRRTDGSDPTMAPHVAIRELVRETGLPVPEPVRVASSSGVIVVLPYVDGVVAADLLRGGSGAAIVGRACGMAAARIASINPDALAALRTSPAARTADGLPGRAPLPAADGLADEARRALGRLLRETEAALLATPAVVAHGDLVPVNLLLRDDRVAAVLDLDRARLAHRDYDAAWYAWVVAHHHPGLIRDAWHGFADAARTPGRSFRDVAWLWPLQLLERVREARDDAERAEWTARLAASLSG